jgi:hypothetical protein
MSNFTYVAFAFNRVSLVDQNHNILTKFMADVGIKKYITASFVISAGLSVVKALLFEVNLSRPDANYPTIFNQNPNKMYWYNETKYHVIIIFNAIFDIVNYLLFIVINLLVDILLIVKLRQGKIQRSE